MSDVRLMTVDPGHFHAALVQKEMYPGVDPSVDVYAPPGGDLDAHLKRIDAFNKRPAQPTAWKIDVHASTDFFERMLRERPGNVVVLSGRNRVEDRADRRVGRGRPARPGGQAVDPEVGGSAAARVDARGGGQDGRGRLRHHDRALRDHLDAAAGAGERPRPCSASR